MKGTNAFKSKIQEHLNERAAADPLFAVTLEKPGKNIDDCCTYIINQVKASGCAGFADEEVYGMAVHYYDEDDIKVGAPISSGQVVVNHVVELSAEDKEQARQLAIQKAVEEEKAQLAKKVKLSAADKEQARQLAIDNIAKEQEARLKQKPKPAKKEPVGTQQSLF